MTDRELLERAAKAAGIVVRWQDAMSGGLFLADTRGIEWNPLTDDGDALRLAVKLRMLVDPDGEIYAYATACPNGKGELSAGEPHRDDPYAATRRAIVRAAAAMAE